MLIEIGNALSINLLLLDPVACGPHVCNHNINKEGKLASLVRLNVPYNTDCSMCHFDRLRGDACAQSEAHGYK